MNHIIQIFVKIKTYLLIFSKLLTISFCTYFILNYTSYRISFNIPSWLKEYNIFVIFNNFLDYIGLTILIIPLLLALSSLLFNEIKWLSVLSSIFSLFTNIFSIAIAYTRGTLQEFMNAKFFVVYHTVSLETKKTIFLSQIHKALENVPNMTKQ